MFRLRISICAMDCATFSCGLIYCESGECSAGCSWVLWALARASRALDALPALVWGISSGHVCQGVCHCVCVCVVLDKERPHDGPVWQGFRGYAELTVDLLTFIFVYLRLNVV